MPAHGVSCLLGVPSSPTTIAHYTSPTCPYSSTREQKTSLRADNVPKILCPIWRLRIRLQLEVSHELASSCRSGTCKGNLLCNMRHLSTVFMVRCCSDTSSLPTTNCRTSFREI